MKPLVEKLYLVSLLELALLSIIVFWAPSEAGNQFFLGRSIYKWILGILPFTAFAFGVSVFILFSKKNKALISWLAKAINIFEALEQKLGYYVIGVCFLVLCFSFTYALSRHFQVLFLFDRFLSWLVVFTLIFLQFTYVFFVYLKRRGELCGLRETIIQVRCILRKCLFEPHPLTKPTHLYETSALYRISASVLILAFLFIAYFFLKFAGLNSDEGWYMYAAREVYLGQRPYQDFAFTQMPLVPYLYGLSFLLYPSMYAGRLTSLILLGASVYLMYRLSKRNQTPEAFLWFFLIVLTYADAFYFNSIVKTYSLTLFFCLLSLCLLAANLNAEIKYPLVALVLLLGFLTRLTFLFFALPVVFYILKKTFDAENKRKIWINLLMINLPIALIGASFLYPAPKNMIWDVYLYNAGIHGFSPSLESLLEFLAHLRGYIYSIKDFWALGIPLGLALLSFLHYRKLLGAKLNLLFVLAAAVFVFLGIHFIGGGPMYEYYIPANLFFAALLLLFLFSFTSVPSGINFLILWSARAALTLVVLSLAYHGRFGEFNYEYYRGHPPIETVKQIAEFIDTYYPDEEIITLEALYVAVEADRQIPDGLSMAQFSILNLPLSEAKSLRFTTREEFIDTIKSPNAKVLILTERELSLFQSDMPENYELVLTVEDFGQKSVNAYVYARRTNGTP